MDCALLYSIVQRYVDKPSVERAMKQALTASSGQLATPTIEPLWTLEEVAAYLRVSPATVRRWTNTGRLACYRFGPSRQRRFSRETVLAFVAEHLEQGRRAA